MNSPFPGMNPYVEDPRLWKGFHTLLIAAIVAALNESLPDGFQARAEERCYIVPPHREIYADVSVSEVFPAEPSATATLVRAAPTGIATLAVSERRERFVEVLDLTVGGRVVTVIEVLSPANKTPGDLGRDAYVRKQGNLLLSQTNLLEIDLLRGGTHTFMVPRAELDARCSYHYAACLYRAADPLHFAFWLNRLPDPLPEVRVPLTDSPAADAFLDLQRAVDRALREGGFARLLDYRLPAEPPLSEGDAAWVAGLVR